MSGPDATGVASAVGLHSREQEGRALLVDVPGNGVTAAEPVQAVLWDMDGLLVDSEPVWTVAEHELAARCGAVFTPEAKHAVVGPRSTSLCRCS